MESVTKIVYSEIYYSIYIDTDKIVIPLIWNQVLDNIRRILRNRLINGIVHPFIYDPNIDLESDNTV
jgi:hypothetical protein